MAERAVPPLPTFLIIGAQKSGTRWLRANLGAHPEVFTADSELRFFTARRNFVRGLDHYRAGFAGWSGEPVVGEASPGYMMLPRRPPEVAERIDASLPGVRLLALLRNPVERAYSAFNHQVRAGRISPDADFVGRMLESPVDDRLALVVGGLYAASLEAYLARFGERLKVLLLDDVEADPAAAYTAAVRHIGASPGFLPGGLERPRHASPAPRGSGGDAAGPSSEERKALWPRFAADVRRLETLLGIDLSRWAP